MKPRAVIVALSLTLWTAPAWAGDGSEKGAFSILFENDLFYNSDHDYTNGIELAYTTAPQDTPDWAVRTARLLPFFARTATCARAMRSARRSSRRITSSSRTRR